MDSLEDELRASLATLTPEQRAELDVLIAPELIANQILVTLPRNWTQRHYQRNAWNYLVNGGKRACLIWHRRAGKDDLALNWACVAAHQRIGEYWHMLPEASQARKAIWDAVSPHTGVRRVDQAFPRDLREKTREDEMVIRFKCGSLWRVVGSDNYNSLIGSTPVGIVFSEWALADPNAWAFLRPILMENRGWAIFITTPRGANHARRTYDLARKDEDWFAESLTVDDTGIFTAEQLQAELREYMHEYGEEEGRALYEQEYNCSFEAALIGSFYGSYLNRASRANPKRIVANIPIDRAVPVNTSWDLGVSDSTAIWFIQVVGKEFRLVDYHEGAGVGLDDYAKVLQAKQQERGWLYGKHYFPHDIMVRELGNKGLSREDTLKGLGIKATVVPQHSVMDGINATRRMLDATWIDETRCERGLNCLRNYRRLWDDKLKMFRDNALHDWASHGADALRIFAAGHKPLKEKTGDEKKPWIPSIELPHERGTGWMGN